MLKHEFIQIGTSHINHCEDFLVTAELGTEKRLIAVMDGSTRGIESYFASTLTGKILRKIAKEMYYKDFVEKENEPLETCLKSVMQQLFEQLKNLKNQLHLGRYELLSTLILGIIDTTEKNAELLTVGDGLICCNGEIIDNDQDNRPDYLGYHLETPFEQWFEEQEQLFSFTNVKDLSICTDGIFTFQAFDNGSYETIEEEEIIQWLLIDQENSQSDKMLQQKMWQLEADFGLKPMDDLTIIRLIF